MSPTSFDPRKQLTEADFKIFSRRALITLRWSKIIQFRERVVEIPLLRIPRSPLCATAHNGERGSFNSADGTIPDSSIPRSRLKFALNPVIPVIHTGESRSCS